MRRAAWLIGFALLMPLAVRGADPALGRLFFTPEQRAALEEARRKNIRAEELAAKAASKPKTPRPQGVVVNGVVMRNDGVSVIWVNGKAVDNETEDGMRVSPTASRETVVLRDPGKGRVLRLKVGQRADLLSGRVEENYEARRAAAHAEAAAAEAELAPTDASKPTDRRPRRKSTTADEPSPVTSAQASAGAEQGAARPTQDGAAPGAAPEPDGTPAATGAESR